MAQFNRIRVQEALIAAAKAGVFYPVSYDPDTQVPTVDEANPATPHTTLANEVGTNFERAVRHRMTNKRERATWSFQLRLKFSQEVLLEVFEDALSANPIQLPAVPAEGLRQVMLELEDSDPTHPVQQESTAGTQVVYNFKASLSPA